MAGLGRLPAYKVCLYTSLAHDRVFLDCVQGKLPHVEGKEVGEQKRVTSPSLEPRAYPKQGEIVQHLPSVFMDSSHLSIVHYLPVTVLTA